MTAEVMKIEKSSYESELDWSFPKVDPGALPLGGRVLLQVRRVRKKSAGGLILTSETQEVERWNTQVAKVVAIGPLAFRRKDTLEPWPEGVWAEVGDFVRSPKYGGDRWEVKIEGEENEPALFMICNDTELIAKIIGDSSQNKGVFMRLTIEQRLLTRATENLKTNCWECSYALNGTPKWYPCIRIAGKTEYTHHVAFWLWVGAIAEGLWVLHTCDNPRCINPEHLFLGTPQDNVKDRDAKGRQAKGCKHGLRLHPERAARGINNGAYTCPEKRPVGETHGRARLTEELVKWIREAPANQTNTDLAHVLQVNKVAIGYVKSKKTWNHVL